MHPPLLEPTTCGLLLLADNQQVLHANDFFCQLVNRTRLRILAEPAEQCLTLASRVLWQTSLVPRLVLNQKLEEASLTLENDGGAPVPVLLNAAARAWGGQRVFECCVLPVRERRRFETELMAAKDAAEAAARENHHLVEAKRELGAYARELDRALSRSSERKNEIARISQLLAHDLSEPARKIQLFADYLQTEMAEPSAIAQRHLLRIQQEGQRIQHLIDQLQAFVRAEPSPDEAEVVALGPLVEHLIEQLKRDRPDLKVIVSTEALPKVRGFAEDLRTLFARLLVGVSTSTTGPIEIRACSLKENLYKTLPDRYHYDDVVRLEVVAPTVNFDVAGMQQFLRDGTKMPREWEQLSFDFALCRKLADHHGGTFTIKVSGHQGTCCTVQLPMVQPG